MTTVYIPQQNLNSTHPTFIPVYSAGGVPLSLDGRGRFFDQQGNVWSFPGAALTDGPAGAVSWEPAFGGVSQDVTTYDSEGDAHAPEKISFNNSWNGLPVYGNGSQYASKDGVTPADDQGFGIPGGPQAGQVIGNPADYWNNLNPMYRQQLSGAGIPDPNTAAGANWWTQNAYDPNIGFYIPTQSLVNAPSIQQNMANANKFDLGTMMPLLMAAGFTGGALGGFLPGAETIAGDAFMPAALGADGMGSVGAAGSGLAGDAYMPAALGADGTGSLGGLTSATGTFTAPTAVAGTSDVAPDVIGSDWATGQATGPTGGSLPTTSTGLTAGNTAAAPYDFVGSDWASGNPTGNVGGSLPQTPGGMTAGNTASSPISSLPNVPPGAQSALQRILSGSATPQDYAKVVSSGVDIAAAMAAYNRQNQLWDSGADSRARFNQGMTNPSSVMSLFKPAVDQATDSYLRGISAKSGNPATLGSAPAETAKYVMGSTMLPAWQGYESLNSGVGWNQPSTNSANAGQQLASAAGQAAGTLTNPNTDLTSTLANLKNMGLIPSAQQGMSYINSLFGNPSA